MLKLRGQLKRQNAKPCRNYIDEIERYLKSHGKLHFSQENYLASILGPDVPEDPRERIAAARKQLAGGKR